MKLTERKSKTGSNFYLKKTINGKQEQIPLGSDKAVAKSRANRFILTMDENGVDAAYMELNGGTPLKKGSPTYEQMETLYKEYLGQSVKALKDKTVYDNLSALKRIMTACNVKTIAELDQQKIRGLMLPLKPTEAQRRGFASTVRCAKSIFKAKALDFYKTKGKNIINPLDKVEISAPKIESYTPLAGNLRDKIRKDCLTLPPCEAMIVILSMEFGLRRSEIEYCETGWFSEQEEMVYLSVQDTEFFKPKTDEKRVFPVSKDVYEELIALRKKTNPKGNFFVYVDASGDTGRLWRRFGNVNKWLKKQGVTATRPIQSMRKEAGSKIAQENGIFEAQRVLGHSSPVMTSKVYAGLTNIQTVGGNKPKKTPEETFAESLGITVEELRKRLAV
jgi:integrase